MKISFSIHRKRNWYSPISASQNGLKRYISYIYQYSIGAKIQIGKVMVKHNFESKKGRNGRRYAVFVIAPEQVKSNRLYE